MPFSYFVKKKYDLIIIVFTIIVHYMNEPVLKPFTYTTGRIIRLDELSQTFVVCLLIRL